MRLKNILLKGIALCIIMVFITSCICKQPDSVNHLQDTETAINYLKDLNGKWEVHGAKEGVFGWEFDVTSRGNVVVERLKVGTPTEMTTVYNIDDGVLLANHYCQLQNQPHLAAVTSNIDGDLHFLCDGKVGNTKSHDELHMHGVHFQKNDSSLIIWMDMFENGEVAFETRYELFQLDSLNPN